jgi:hypothetical protein
MKAGNHKDHEGHKETDEHFVTFVSFVVSSFRASASRDRCTMVNQADS